MTIPPANRRRRKGLRALGNTAPPTPRQLDELWRLGIEVIPETQSGASVCIALGRHCVAARRRELEGG